MAVGYSRYLVDKATLGKGKEVTGSTALASLIKQNQLSVVAKLTTKKESQSPQKDEIIIGGIRSEEVAEKIREEVIKLNLDGNLEGVYNRANSIFSIKLAHPEAHKFGEGGSQAVVQLTALLEENGVKLVRSEYNQSATSGFPTR